MFKYFPQIFIFQAEISQGQFHPGSKCLWNAWKQKTWREWLYTDNFTRKKNPNKTPQTKKQKPKNHTNTFITFHHMAKRSNGCQWGKGLFIVLQEADPEKPLQVKKIWGFFIPVEENGSLCKVSPADHHVLEVLKEAWGLTSGSPGLAGEEGWCRTLWEQKWW